MNQEWGQMAQRQWKPDEYSNYEPAMRIAGLGTAKAKSIRLSAKRRYIRQKARDNEEAETQTEGTGKLINHKAGLKPS